MQRGTANLRFDDAERLGAGSRKKRKSLEGAGAQENKGKRHDKKDNLCYSKNINGKALFEKLDRIIFLLESTVKEPALLFRVGNGIATGIGILGILSVVDVIRTWLGR